MSAAATVIVVLVLSYPLLSFFPNSLLYYNSMVRGPEGAKAITIVGYGEGHREAVLYLKEICQENNTISVAGFSPIVSYYYPDAHILDLTRWREADYLVVYISWLQRNPDHELTKYVRDKQPIYTVALAGCSLAWIYKISP